MPLPLRSRPAPLLHLPARWRPQLSGAPPLSRQFSLALIVARSLSLSHAHTHLFCSSTPSPTIATTIMGWLRLVGSFKLQVSFAKEPYKRDYILQNKCALILQLYSIFPHDGDHNYWVPLLSPSISLSRSRVLSLSSLVAWTSCCLWVSTHIHLDNYIIQKNRCETYCFMWVDLYPHNFPRTEFSSLSIITAL